VRRTCTAGSRDRGAGRAAHADADALTAHQHQHAAADADAGQPRGDHHAAARPVTLRGALLAPALAMVLAAIVFANARAATGPYLRVPSAGDHVRFDASAAGEKLAWAYPNLNYLEAFLRSTIDAAIAPTTYAEYQKKMELVLAKSLTFENGTSAVVQHVQTFVYRNHTDVEVQTQVTSGEASHAVVWTTPAELVDSSGRSYLH
jgi:hypothetical protein